MADFSSRLPKRRTVFRVLSIAVAMMFFGGVLLAFWVYRQSVGKFEIRRLSLPTRIFADYTPLRAGTGLLADDLAEKLERLGYRNASTAGTLAQPGDFIATKGQFDIYTRAFTHPSGNYP